MEKIQYPAYESGFYKQKLPKNKIVLHHTAGSHNPYYVVDGWRANKNKVGTAYVIGGMDNNIKLPYPDLYDGTILEYFNPDHWAHHLGINETNYAITKSSVGIELCNYGYLIKNDRFQYLTYHGQVVPESQVEQCKFRGYDYYEKYTEAQIQSLKELLLELATRYSIDLHEGIYTLLKKGNKSFEYQSSAIQGKGGLWTHTNYRKAGKWDCSPQSGLVEMILSL
jgi:N-acetyl-anhydromuramyl-L-alanine amidase AmpD